jgi:hypothetical protein
VPNTPKLTRRVSMKAPTTASFELGTVEAPQGETFAGGAKKLILEAGKRKVTLVGGAENRTLVVVVKPGATVIAK